MDYPKFIVSNQKDESISIQMVKHFLQNLNPCHAEYFHLLHFFQILISSMGHTCTCTKLMTCTFLDKQAFWAYNCKFFLIHSTLDKQRICINTQLKSSKKQLKWNVCVLKSKSSDWYAITCDVNAYHLVHFLSIWVINKWQSGIDFFTSERSI